MTGLDDERKVQDVEAGVEASPSKSSSSLEELDENKLNEMLGEEPDLAASDPLKDVPAATLSEMYRYATQWDMFLVFLANFLALANGATLPLFALLFGDLLDSVNDEDKVLETTRDLSLMLLYIGFATFVGSAAEMILNQIVADRMVQRMRSAFLAALLRQDATFHDCKPSGEMVARLTEYGIAISNGLGGKLGQVIHFTGTGIGALVMGFIVEWRLMLVCLATVPLLIGGGMVLMFAGETYEKTIKSAYARAGAHAAEVLANLRTVVAFGREVTESGRYKRELATAEAAGSKKGLWFGLGMGLTFGGMFAMYALGLWYGSQLILDSREEDETCFYDFVDRDKCITGGTVMQVLFAAMIGGFSLGQAGPYVAALTDARTAAGKMYSVIDAPVGIDGTSEEGEKVNPHEMRGEIEFKDVKFSYPTRQGEEALSGVSFKVEPGQVVAFVGESGSGKSTIVKLVQRLYDPKEGSVTIDGRNLRDLNVGSLRAALGVVSQMPMLFGMTVEENIRLGGIPGEAPPTKEQVRRAAKQANAAGFIEEDLDSGYDTHVGQRGSQLSGGQRQRVAIARALVREPHVLAFDEATAALDEKSQRVVQKAIDRVVGEGGRTVLIVAHRLSTIRSADKIFVMDKGRIVQSGSHDEMIDVPGPYRELYLATQADQEDDGEGGGEGSGVAASSDKKGEGEEEVLERKRLVSVESAKSSLGGGDERDGDGRKESTTKKSTAALALSQVEKARLEREAVKKEIKAYDSVPISRIVAYQSGDIPFLVLGTICAALNGLIMPLWANAFSEFLGALYKEDKKMEAEVMEYVWWHVGIAIGSLVTQIGQYYSFSIAGERLTRRLRGHAYEQLLRAEVSYFDLPTHAPGRLASRLSKDAAVVRAATGETMGLYAQNIVGMVGAMIIAFIASWEISLLVLATVPCMAIGGYLESQSYLHNEDKEGDEEDSEEGHSAEAAGGTAFEAVTQIQTVHAFGMEKRVSQIFTDTLLHALTLQERGAAVGGSGFAFSQFIQFAVYALVFGVGALLIDSGDVEFEDLMKAFFALTFGSYGLGQSMIIAGDVAKAGDASKSIFSIIDRKSAIDSYSAEGEIGPPDSAGKGAKDLAAGAKAPRALGRITLDNVSFTYPSRPDTKVLDGVSIDIEPGSTVALVGPSGSGKSTVAQLLLRLYDPDDGCLKLDGLDMRKYNVPWLRAQFGIVMQEPVLMHDDVGYNIAWGRASDAETRERSRRVASAWAAGDRTLQLVDGGKEEDVDAVATLRYRGTDGDVDPEIKQAASDANATGFIEGFKRGFAEHVGFGGEHLSGGQRQRVAIARALVREPPILVFDEATSALDRTSEAAVQSAIDRIIDDKGSNVTSVIIAHRLGSIRQADKIVVMAKGRVVEQGSHDELLAKDGLYKQLWEISEGAGES